jgi:hypothetical protein
MSPPWSPCRQGVSGCAMFHIHKMPTPQFLPAHRWESQPSTACTPMECPNLVFFWQMDGPWRKSHHLEFPHYPARCKWSNIGRLSAVSSLMVLDFSNGLIYRSLGHLAWMMMHDMKYPYITLQLLFFSRGGGGGRGEGRVVWTLYRPPRRHPCIFTAGGFFGNPSTRRLARTMSRMPIWCYDDRGKRRYTQRPWCCKNHSKPKRLFCPMKTNCIQWDSTTPTKAVILLLNTQINKYTNLRFPSLRMFFPSHTVLCLFVWTEKWFCWRIHKYTLQNDQNFICVFVNFYLLHK